MNETAWSHSINGKLIKKDEELRESIGLCISKPLARYKTRQLSTITGSAGDHLPCSYFDPTHDHIDSLISNSYQRSYLDIAKEKEKSY